MKKQLMTGLFTVLALTAGAQTFQEWRNPEINAVNRAPMHTNYFAFENADAAKKADKKQDKENKTEQGSRQDNDCRQNLSLPFSNSLNALNFDKELLIKTLEELQGDEVFLNKQQIEMSQRIQETLTYTNALAKNSEIINNILLDLIDLTHVDNSTFKIKIDSFSVPEAITYAQATVSIQCQRLQLLHCDCVPAELRF